METETPQGAQPQLPELTPRQAAYFADAEAGLSHREIAVKHGVSVPTVTTVLYRLRKRLERVDEEQPVLTFGQLEILSMLGVGRSYEEVAVHLCISPRTVREQVKLARARLSARNQMHLLSLAISQELLILDHDGQLLVPYGYRLAAVPALVA